MMMCTQKGVRMFYVRINDGRGCEIRAFFSKKAADRYAEIVNLEIADALAAGAAHRCDSRTARLLMEHALRRAAAHATVGYKVGDIPGMSMDELYEIYAEYVLDLDI